MSFDKKIFVLVLGILMVAAVSRAEDTPAPSMDPAAMEAMQKATMPGEAHKVLEQLAGNWTYTAKFYMPGQPVVESEGSSHSEIIYDGRFLKDTVTGTWMGKSFEGTGFTGYDNIRGEYQSIWLDNAMTGIMSSSGLYDPATKTLNLSGACSCPMTGEKNRQMRSETKVLDADHYTMTSYAQGPDGKEAVTMELSYTRA